MEQKVSWLKNGLFAGLMFGVIFGALQGLKRGSALVGLETGLATGALFGVSLALIARAKVRELAAAGVDETGEPVLLQGPANHWKGAESVGGKLYLTRSRLRFRSHGFNVQVHEESYPVPSIRSVEPGRSLGIIPNALWIVLADGRREKFVVNGRAEWVERVRATLSS